MAQSVSFPSKGRLEIVFLDAVTATDNGKWFRLDPLSNISIDISGITTATVQIFGSNASTQPSDATDGRQIGFDVTSDSIVSITTPIKYLKVKVSAYTSGTISARGLGVVGN